MFIAGLSVLAALAFVLGLGAFALWTVKRFGAGTLTQRSRVPLEVVQRVALGPKTGLAVVRVGEKVMAVSIGDGGIRPLFELDESDRQRIIASSTVATPMVSSAEASAALAKFLPSVRTSVFGRLLNRSMDETANDETASDERATARVAPTAYTNAQLASPRPLFSSDREFRAMLGMSLRDTTRLAVFVGAVVLSAFDASLLRAQGQPPVQQPPVRQPVALPVQPPVAPPVPVAAGTQGAATNAARPVQAAVPVATPTPLAAPPLAQPAAGRAPRATAARTGNGSSVTPGGAAARRPTSSMVFDSLAAAQASTGRAGAAAPAAIAADDAIMRMMPQMDVKLGDAKDGGLRLNGTVGIVVMMGLLTLLPTLILMMTGFTRILIVLHFLKQAMGTQGAPPAHLLAGLALLLTGFVMAPTLSQMNRDALTPWMEGKITQVEMMKVGVQPMREFMLKQTRESDIKTFVELSRMPRPETVDDLPLHVLMSAFVASELRTAFQIGFAIYLPFIIIDTVVASVLMSMGMFMLPPAMISLPFKLLLFVLVDGWSLTIQSLVASFK